MSLEEARESRAQATYREELHKQFDMFLDKLEDCMIKKKPTLEELTQAVFQMRNELTSFITEGFLKRCYANDLKQQRYQCPQCGRILMARGTHDRVIETMVGTFTISRPYFYCIECQQGFYPVDETLALSKRRKQVDIQKAVSDLAKEVPYDTASQLFQNLTGIPVGEHAIHEIVNEVAEDISVLDVCPTREEISEKIASISNGRKWRPILVIAVDGGHVPTRPEEAKGKRRGRKKKRTKRACWKGEWREAKGFRFYLVDNDRILHLISWHQISTDEELALALQQIKDAHLIPEDDVRLCIIGDGAKWIWNRLKEIFPTAREVLDYYHCNEHLHKVAVLQYGDDIQKMQEWKEATLTRLFLNEVDSVIEGLQQMEARDTETASEIKKLIRYLENNRHRVDYGSIKKGGYPIASGGIESSNKFVSHVRLKRSGAWWYVKNANRMLALRCAKYNGTFDRIFDIRKQQVKGKSEEGIRKK